MSKLILHRDAIKEKQKATADRMKKLSSRFDKTNLNDYLNNEIKNVINNGEQDYFYLDSANLDDIINENLDSLVKDVYPDLEVDNKNNNILYQTLATDIALLLDDAGYVTTLIEKKPDDYLLKVYFDESQQF